MALGLFSSLIIGLILPTAGEQFGLLQLVTIGQTAMGLMGPAIGVAIAYGLKAPPLVLFASAAAGAFGAVSGGPAGAYVASLLAVETGKLLSGSTRLDIILTPLVTILVGYFAAESVGVLIHQGMIAFGDVINWSVERQPFLMGILVATLMGFALTAPISSTAIAIMLGLDGLAAGAAAIGCSAQMVGFAAIGYRDNGVGGLLALGIGTSMLQVANILKNPFILIPPTIAGAVLAPFATVWLKLENNAAGAGMGTSGFVGQIMTFEAMGFSMNILWSMLILHIIAPALISWLIAEWFRKKGWIKPGDMKIVYE